MPDHTKRRTKRIVIIGAGPAGLTAAESLKQQGYSNIIILERSNRAGGKCFSPNYEGRAYELGAGIVSANNRTVLALAKQFNVSIEQVVFGKSIMVDVETGKHIPEKQFIQKLSTLRELLFRYVRLVKKYHNVSQPGLTHIDPALSVSFSTWAKQHKLERVAEELAPFFTGFGYDYFERIPAVYVLKYYSWETMKAFAKRKLYKFPNGIQSLWTTIAGHNDVRYNTIINRIQRDTTITITTQAGTIECDDLIIASPLDESLNFLDASAEEQNLFKKIIYCDYRTFAVFVNNFHDPVGYLPGNYTVSRMGHPVFWYQRHEDSNLFTFYILGDWKITDEQALQNITKVIQQRGGSIEKIHTIEHWKYFPHVREDDMRAGYFDRLEQLQSQRNTYYAGEVLNFSTVGLSAEYSENLVKRFFA